MSQSQSKDGPQKDLLDAMALVAKRFRPGGDLAPIEDREQWEQLVASKPPEERELLQELARFADLWRYFQERDESLGSKIVDGMRELNKLPVPERIRRLKDINLELMKRVGDDGQGAQFRQ
jgi:hypothetical protein